MRRRLALLALAAIAVLALPAAASAQDGPPGPQVVGGTDVPDGKYPFMASLQDHRSGETPVDRHRCGATLIDSQRVLTAAHCISRSEEGNDPLVLAQLSVLVGRTVLSNASQGQERGIEFILVYPDRTFDAAVLFLDEPVTGIDPIKLVTPGSDVLERPGTRLVATGWGYTRPLEPGQPPSGPGVSDRMQEVEVPVVSDEECEIAYPEAFKPASEMCAGQRGKDTCFGDSGGPLFRQVPGREEFFEAGMTFYGAGCAAQGFPGVYSQLSNESIGGFIRNPFGIG
jgi:secreted trypsin-like serine protease